MILPQVPRSVSRYFTVSFLGEENLEYQATPSVFCTTRKQTFRFQSFRGFSSKNSRSQRPSFEVCLNELCLKQNVCFIICIKLYFYIYFVYLKHKSEFKERVLQSKYTYVYKDLDFSVREDQAPSNLFPMRCTSFMYLYYKSYRPRLFMTPPFSVPSGCPHVPQPPQNVNAPNQSLSK